MRVNLVIDRFTRDTLWDLDFLFPSNQFDFLELEVLVNLLVDVLLENFGDTRVDLELLDEVLIFVLRYLFHF